ncbi:hypothetical protein ACSSS7_007093 [Eimeria intestinalis]
MGEGKDVQSVVLRGSTDKPFDWVDHTRESPSFMNWPSQFLFSRRLTPLEVVSLWRILEACSSSALTATPQPTSAPEQQQQPQHQQQQQHAEVIDEASPTGFATKSQAKAAASQPGNKPSEKDKKHRKSQKEQKAAQPVPKKHPSSSGRPGVAAASPAVSTPQAAAAGEGLSSGCESRLGAPSLHGPSPSAGKEDPGEAIRSALGVPICGIGGDAAVGLVLRTLLFCKDYLLRPEVTSCVVSFLGVQLQWLCCWGSCAARRLPSARKQGAGEQTEPGLSARQTEASSFEENSRSGCLSPKLEHLGYLSRHLTRETKRFLTHLRGCDSLKQQQKGEALGANKAGAAEEFGPALKGSISATEAEMLHSFLLNALINHGYFFAVVLASSFAPREPQTGNVPAAAAPAAAPLAG